MRRFSSSRAALQAISEGKTSSRFHVYFSGISLRSRPREGEAARAAASGAAIRIILIRSQAVEDG
jgi:hypothetical protein